MKSAKSFWFLFYSALIFLVFGRSLSFSFLSWDDVFHICNNPYFNSSDKNIGHLWTTDFLGLYAPVAYTVWGGGVALARALWGENSSCAEWAGLFHFINMILHLGNTLLVFFFLKKVLPAKKVAFVALGAALFAIHPVQVEAVLWVSAGRDLLSFLFGMSGILLLLHDRWKTATLFFALSCLAKATGVVFPLLGLVLMFHEKNLRGALRLIPSFLVYVGFGVLAKTLQPDVALKFDSPIWQRPFVFVHNLGFYFQKVFLPLDLAPDYTRSISYLNLNPVQFWPVAVFLLVVGLLWLAKGPLGSQGISWVLVSLLPVSGIIPFGFQETSTVADRYFYTAMVGISIVAVHLLSRFGEIQSKRVGTLVLASFSGLSFHQTGYWKNDVTLFTHNVEAYPASGISHHILGRLHLRNGEFIKAESSFRKVLEVRPPDYLIILDLAVALQGARRFDEAEKVYLMAIEKNIVSSGIFNNLGTIYFKRNQFVEAEKLWREAGRVNEFDFEAQFNLGVLYLQQNKLEESLAAFVKAKKNLPQHPLIDAKLAEVRNRMK